jgi:dihydrofolate reductase
MISLKKITMSRIISFMHTSLDGFIAGPNGEMDWIIVDEDIFDFVGDRTNQSDTALYGRKTYEMMDAYWPEAGKSPGASKHDKEHSAWYNRVEKIVISRSLKGKMISNTTIISDNLKEEINKVKNRTGKDILIFGSPSATHSLMEENLVDGYWLFINPILLGKGIPFFKNIQERTKLKLVKSNAFKSGVVCVSYEVLK